MIISPMARAASWLISLRSDVATARPRVFPLIPIFVQRWENETLCRTLSRSRQSAGEILFGLIMTLTVTLSAGLAADEGRAGVRQLLAAAIGCNLAWGIIDAVMYVMNCITVRSGK